MSFGDGQHVHISWSGVTNDTCDQVMISGLFAAKLGIQEGEKVCVTPVQNIGTCKQLYMEPLSVDDWEILELHELYIESHLLDQVRVVSAAQVLPIWINNAICIFVIIGKVEPQESCVVLEQMTEVIISPKTRASTNANPGSRHQGPMKGQQMSRSEHSINPKESLQNGSIVQHDETSSLKMVSEAEMDSSYLNSWVVNPMKKMFGRFSGKQEKELGDSEIDSPCYDGELLDERINVVFRVQALKADYECHCAEKQNKKPRHISYVSSQIDDFSSSSSSIPMESSSIIHSSMCCYVHQPTCVFINSQDTSNINTDTFLAKITRMQSPIETQKVLKKKADKLKSKLNQSNQVKDNVTNIESEKEMSEIVRVVLVTGTHANNGQAVQVKQGHVVIHDLLRQKLGIGRLGRVKVTSITEDDSTITGLTLQPLFTPASYLSDDMLKMALQHWGQFVPRQQPMVVSQHTPLSVQIQPGVSGDFLLTALRAPSVSRNTEMSCEYGLLDSDLLHMLDSKVLRTPDSVQAVLMSSLSSIDPPVPSVDPQTLGGFEDCISSATDHISVCLDSHPVLTSIFTETHGIQNGCLLICGAKGVGKTSLANAVCHKLAGWPTLAYTTVISCKPLKGKRIDTLKQLIENAIHEASWRQPSVILLDDLDHVTAAPSGPETEAGTEATYYSRVADVLQDVLTLHGASRMAVMATARSRASLHATLTASRGKHIFQKVIEIPPPNKIKRTEILRAIINNSEKVNSDCIDDLDLETMATRTEGYVARDLVAIVTRSIHAHWISNNKITNKEVTVTMCDMDAALHGFTPVCLRNVPLHRVGELGWRDVGGLHAVRKTLVDTLMLPSKYPSLFSRCPLRLRSGLLLYGPPGSGKTLLAGVIAKECELNFISIKGPELLNKYIGASELAVRDTFTRAHTAKPCILFFDEFDSLAPRRGHDSTGVTDRVVNQLLTQLDGVEGLDGVCILAATSRPDLIDPALLRPGRLDKCLQCTIPNKDERLEILHALVRNVPLAEDASLQAINDRCDWFTGADLKALLYNAQLEAIHELTDAIMEEVIHDEGGPSRETINTAEQRVPCTNDRDTVNLHRTDAIGDIKDGSQTIAAEATSLNDGGIMYMPRLEHGMVHLELNLQKTLQDQVESVKKKKVPTATLR